MRQRFPPEPDTFLRETRDEMRRYKETTGRYADEWFLLGFGFRGNGYHQIDDPEVYPRPRDGSRWRPPECRHTYVIQRSSESGFLVHALNDAGDAVFELDHDMEDPRQLLDLDCGWELVNPQNEEQKFLDKARFQMGIYFSKHRRYASTWEELGLHWAMVKHTRNDPRALPPRGTGASWKPLGSRFTYTITHLGGDDYVMRSFEDNGRPRLLSRNGSNPIAIEDGPPHEGAEGPEQP